ncbi:MAG: hypothetical protein Fur0037_25570 [Planctomycetota bacterium]
MQPGARAAASARAVLALMLLAPGMLAQEPPHRADWDTVSANLLLTLLLRGYVQPKVEHGGGEIRILIVGNDRFGRAVESLARGKKASGKNRLLLCPLRVSGERLDEQRERMRSAHVIVVATEDEKVERTVLWEASGRPILLCGREPDFVRHGGHILLWLSEDGKPAFEIAEKALAELGIGVEAAAVKASRKAPRRTARRADEGGGK